MCVSGPSDRAALGEQSQSPAVLSSPAASSWEGWRMICPLGPVGWSVLQNGAVSDSTRRPSSPRGEDGLRKWYDAGTR